MPPDGEHQNDPPPAGIGRALQIAIAHEQVLLASIAGFDGKLMLLTVLNVAGVSALVGIAASADPITSLFGLSMASCAICALAGLGNLWARDVDQFPTPDEAMRAVRQNPSRIREGKTHSSGNIWRLLKRLHNVRAPRSLAKCCCCVCSWPPRRRRLASWSLPRSPQRLRRLQVGLARLRQMRVRLFPLLPLPPHLARRAPEDPPQRDLSPPPQNPQPAHRRLTFSTILPNSSSPNPHQLSLCNLHRFPALTTTP